MEADAERVCTRSEASVTCASGGGRSVAGEAEPVHLLAPAGELLIVDYGIRPGASCYYFMFLVIHCTALDCCSIFSQARHLQCATAVELDSSNCWRAPYLAVRTMVDISSPYIYLRHVF